jgi:acyl transferase domain-containing protein/acyl-CoA synthetase (AMP-forming)/AMP-acid ligase II/SAM-dependent methyltransferase/acyl carrier protein
MADYLPSVGDFANLIDLLRFRASDSPAAGYCYLPDDAKEIRLSFGELELQARSVAATLQERGGEAGQRVLLCYPPGVDFLIGLFGTLYAGMVAVPLYPPRAHRADTRFDGIVENCEPSVVLTSTSVHRDFERLTNFTPRLRGIPCFDTCSVSPLHAAGWRDPRPGTMNLAILQYTSGSTGTPRGVMLNHECVLHNLVRMCQILGLNGPGSDGLCWLPAFHDMGLIGNFLTAILSGTPLAFFAPATFARDPVRWLQTISARRTYISGGPCFAYRHCLSRVTQEMCRGLDLSCWQVAYVGAEPVSAADLDRFVTTYEPFGFRREAFLPTYGLAESTLMVSSGPRTALPVVCGFKASALDAHRVEPDDKGRKLVGCGQAIGDLEICIVDAAGRMPLPDNRIGEIWVTGPSVAAGYWGQADETAATFAARRADRPNTTYLRTGDLGFIHSGELYISGRSKDLLIICGRNFYPQDLENAADTACPDLRDQLSAAFAVDAADGLQVVLVHEVRRGYKPGLGAELFDRARAAIAEQFEIQLHMMALVKSGSLPRASSGKIRRRECSRLFQAGELAIVEVLASPVPVVIAETLPDAPAPAAPAPAVPAPAAPAPAAPAPIAPEPAGPKIDAPGVFATKAVREWLTQRLGRHLNVPAERIDADRPFASYGLDSVAMLTMAADLEKWLGRQVSPTVLYSTPTISTLSRYLAGTAHAAGQSCAPELSETRPAPIAVIGIGCRLPHCHGPDQFWEALKAGRCLVSDLPAGRWPTVPASIPCTRGAYLDDVQHFDAAFFGIAPREAVFIDPQQRILLEATWEALEHAGLAPDRLAGSATGIFVGISTSDYCRLLVAHAGHADAYLGTGNAGSMAANRLSYHLDFHGPSVAVDTACSSSLVAVHMACQSLRARECALAVAAGVNLILAPELTESLARAGMLSPSGRCQAFAAAADGYVRGEGCGAVVLKQLSAAVRDGDPILAVLEASAVNQDGQSNGITAPNGAAQAELIRRCLQLAGRLPIDIAYIEAHGTGTPLGDPIEFEALQATLGNTVQPCAVGSVKTNAGHLEAAAGIIGLIKAVLQVERGLIVPHLHLDELNPRITLEGSRFRFPRATETWNVASRVAGVSSFGFGGTNAHVIVAQRPQPVTSESEERSRYLLPLAAKSEPALRAMAQQWADRLHNDSTLRPADVCATASRGRAHFAHRLAVTGTDRVALADAMSHWLAGVPEANCHAGVASDLSGRVAFLFTGQGSQYAGMGQQLDAATRCYRETLDQCDQILRGLGFASLRDMLAHPTRLDDTGVAQPALFALEYALAQTWRHWGIEPAALLGHSVGEFTAACVAGVFSLEDGLKLITERGRMMQACPDGAMLACFAAPAVVGKHLERWQDRLSVAAINGPDNLVVSGHPGAIDEFQADCAASDIPTRRLKVQRAFHSAGIEAALAGLEATASAMLHREPRIPLISNLTGQFMTGAPNPDYWSKHARGTVQFAAGIQALTRAGITHFVEVGPDPVLCRLGPACLTEGKATWLPSLRHGGNDYDEMQAGLARLYVDGAVVDWRRFDEGLPRQHVNLPTYPFQRRRFWIDAVPRQLTAAATVAACTPKPAVRRVDWQPRSHWSQPLPRSSTGFDALPGGLEALSRSVVADVKPRHRLEQLSAGRHEFDRLAGAYVANTLQQLGWQPTAGERTTTNTLAARFGVAPTYRRLLERLLAMAAEDRWLQKAADDWVVIQAPARSDIDLEQGELQKQFPAFTAELRLAHRCATRMHLVMRGAEDALQVLFSDEASAWTAQLYERSPVSRFYNELLACTVRDLVLGLAARRPLRILELGAGTGGTTSYILPMLPADRVEYVFTDVSRLFLAQAHERFRGYSYVQYRLLDIEADPATQGFAYGQFDIVLAANVLHATGDLRHSVANARRLLAPCGMLALLEGTGPRRLLDLIFGLTDGWWKFADIDLRPNYPLLPPARWLELLRAQGFTETMAMPAVDADLPDPDQVVLLASAEELAITHGDSATCDGSHNAGPAHGQRNGAATRESQQSSTVTWVLVGSHSEVRNLLALRLRECGHEVVLADKHTTLSQLPASSHGSTLRIVDFGETAAHLLTTHAADCWFVSCGAARVCAAPVDLCVDGTIWPPEREGQHNAEGRFIDLDPSQEANYQAICLGEALLHPDEWRAVAYRGDQRYVIKQEEAMQPTQGAQVAGALDRSTLHAAAPLERRALLESHVRREFAAVLGLELVDEDLTKPLRTFGLDSLMGLQFRNRVEAALGISLSIVEILRGASLSQIIDNALTEFTKQQPGVPLPPVPTLPGDLTPEKIQGLSEGEIDTLLQSLLAAPAIQSNP